MKHKNPPFMGNRLHRQSGVTLVELMVAMTIGLFLLGAVGMIYVTVSNSSRSSTLESQMNEDASLALDLLQQQIRLAGFSTVGADGKRVFSGLSIRGCDGGFTDNSGTANFGMLACANVDTGPDAIAVRYEATTLNSQEVDVSGVMRPDNCSHNGITPWIAGAGEGSAASISLADNRYYIADDSGVPTLYCKGRDGSATDGFSDAAALIPNIENLQIQYAITNTPVADEALPHQVTAYVEAKDAVLGATLTNWSRVAALRVCLIARSAQPVPTGDNSRADLGWYRDCNGAEQTVQDRYLRRAYVTTIQLRNMRPGLPAPYEVSAGVVVNPWAHLADE